MTLLAGIADFDGSLVTLSNGRFLGVTHFTAKSTTRRPFSRRRPRILRRRGWWLRLDKTSVKLIILSQHIKKKGCLLINYDSPSSARPVIPKRGEKEFEPRDGGGSNLQLHVLDRARLAMFDTLRATRSISRSVPSPMYSLLSSSFISDWVCSKAVSYASWYPYLARTHVTMARGIHFSNMGHSAPRPVEENGIQKVQKRLELLPEEAIYLIERGSLFCWKQTDLDLRQMPGLNDINGSPMSVQQAYTEMIGRDGLTLEKFQVRKTQYFSWAIQG